jgi:integrase
MLGRRKRAIEQKPRRRSPIAFSLHVFAHSEPGMMRYLAAAPPLFADVATILTDTGMRPDECYSLRWEDITWVNGRNGTLLVTRGNTAAARRVLPMTPRVRAVLYSLRHTFLTRLGQSGCDAWTLARIAGHSSVAMSSRYCSPFRRRGYKRGFEVGWAQFWAQ